MPRRIFNRSPDGRIAASEEHSGYLKHPIEYGIWSGMKKRCKSDRSIEVKVYKSRGIKVCERWMDFWNFYEDMGDRPSSFYSLDRINNDGDYCPENCKWSTKSEQQRNKRTSKMKGITREEILRMNETMSQTEIAKHFGVGQYTVSRIINGNRWKEGLCLHL
jgi:hypothetical protein